MYVQVMLLKGFLGDNVAVVNIKQCNVVILKLELRTIG